MTYIPTDEQIEALRRREYTDEAWNSLPQKFHDAAHKIYREEFDSPEFQAIIGAAQAEAWAAALDHVSDLSDPAYTCELTNFTEIVTPGDVEQARRENPYNA